MLFPYGMALVSRIDKIKGLFRKKALQKRRYSAKETYDFIDPTNRSHPIGRKSRQISVLREDPIYLQHDSLS